MAWDERAPLKRFLRHQATVDRDLRRILLSAANDARSRLAGLDPQGLRAAQLQLQQEQLRLWAKVGTVIDDGITGNAPVVTDINRIFTKELLDGLGVRSSPEFLRSMQAQAQNTIRTYLARQNLGMTLSERVYRNGQVASGRIDRIIGNGILRGASAREIARDVHGLINPNTPGGVSHAAMRLARTELNNSFHEASNAGYAANPFVSKVEWHLSATHPRADDCDNLVATYEPQNVPSKPHPQCLCFTTPETMPRAELVRRFKSGEFDEWADGVLSA